MRRAELAIYKRLLLRDESASRGDAEYVQQHGWQKLFDYIDRLEAQPRLVRTDVACVGSHRACNCVLDELSRLKRTLDKVQRPK